MGRPKKYPTDHTFVRICSGCDVEIIYKSQTAYNDAVRNNRKCRNCGCWNRGLTKETDIRVKRQSEIVSSANKGKDTWNKGLTKSEHPSLQIIGEKRKGKKHSQLALKKISDASKLHWQDDEYRRKVIENATIGIRKAYAEGRVKFPIKYNTTPELVVRCLLDEMGVKYTPQYKIKASYPQTRVYIRYYDFLLDEYNIIIEVHGDYWHGNPTKYKLNELNHTQRKTKGNDADKLRIALNHGFNVHYVWEEETKYTKQLYEKISKILSTNKPVS